MYAAIFLKLKPVLTEFYVRVTKHLDEIAKALDTMVAVLKKTNTELDKNFETDFGKLSYDKIIQEYFIDAEDPDSVLNSIPAASALKNVYYRQLKPIMSSTDINNLLADDRTRRLNKKPVMAEIGKQLQNLLAISDDTIKTKRFDSSDEALKHLPKELATLISANVHLADKVGNETFMDAHFSFDEVLKKNIKCWNILLQESGSTDLANLKDRFRDFLGVDDEDYDEDNCLDKETLLKKIVFSLVKSCKPWIQVVPNSKLSESLDCTILLPQKIDNPAELANEIKRTETHNNVSMSANIKCPGNNENALNLPSDRIVVFNAEVLQDENFAPMDKIQNLTFWNKDSAVNALLVLAEGPREGETAWFKFEDGSWIEKQRGMAYVSPIFETGGPLESFRWHPWLKETTVSMDEAQRAKAHKALFYAFLGNGPVSDTVKTVLAGFKCEQPLLSEDKQDFSFNYAKPRYWSGTEMVASTKKSPWEINISSKQAKHGINHLVNYLCGKGDVSYQADGGNKFLESKESGKVLCDELNTEAEVFFKEVFAKLGDADKKQLITSLYDWLSAQSAKSTGADKEDREYWDALLKFADKESEELGVIIQ